MTQATPGAPATLAFEEAVMTLEDLSTGKMFGARVARAGEHLALVLDGEELVVYLGEGAAAAIAEGRAVPWGPMGAGKPSMKGYVVVPQEAYAEDPTGAMPWALAARAAALARPPKPVKAPKAAAAPKKKASGRSPQ